LSQIGRSQILIRFQLQLFQDASEIVDRFHLSETEPPINAFAGNSLREYSPSLEILKKSFGFLHRNFI